MKLKHINKLLFFVLAIITLSSCNSDSDTISLDASADAQIYSFALAAIADNAVDSVNYPILASTLFSIDQGNRIIYNRDSLPYQTRLKNYAVTISYSSATPSKVELIYADSVAEWNGSDSVDFSLHPNFKVTAAVGATSTREYTIDIRIRKVDPELINWNKQVLLIPSSVKEQKTLLKENDGFYTFSIDKDNQFYLHKTNAAVTDYETKLPINGINASDVLLESITLFNGKFYAIDKSKNGYSSSDGINWSQKSSGIKALLGVLPGASADKDALLVITDRTQDSFAKTTDMATIDPIRILSDFESAGISFSGFSSVTNYDRSNLNKNILAVTAGQKADNSYSNLTWFMQVDGSGVFRVTSNQQHNRFAAKAGIASFMYDGYLYALTDNKFYKSMFADSWNLAPDKEQFSADMVSTTAQSVIVDDENNIWIFGGISGTGDFPVLDIWKGRLNKLNP